LLDYAGLAAVAAVVRQGSFERAADTLGVTPSAVSQRVRALEERTGTALIIKGAALPGHGSRSPALRSRRASVSPRGGASC
jgi:DNA-binding transcriptional LysR family regulator